MLELFIVFAITFLAVFAQTTLGFGVALIAMPLLVAAVGLPIAAPLVAIVSLTCRIFILARYRADFSWRKMWRLMLTAALSTPIGFLISHELNGQLIEGVLGAIVVAYAAFSLLNPDLPPFEHRAWDYGFGSVSGILSGAYNIGGLPVAIYASGKRWPPGVFKGNLQAFTMISSPLVILTRALDGEFTAKVINYYWITLPAVALGLVAGFFLDRHLEPSIFRKMVLVMLIAAGGQLILQTI